MNSIVEGFESTIQELMKGQDDLREEKDKELEALKKEKEAATEETASVEKAFSDLHKRFVHDWAEKNSGHTWRGPLGFVQGLAEKIRAPYFQEIWAPLSPDVNFAISSCWDDKRQCV